MSTEKINFAVPNLIIIGSAKCGTTTIADFLASHSDCCFSRPKEVHFFSEESLYEKGGDWYRKSFLHYDNEKIIGEATPNYSSIPTKVNCADRIYAFNPKCKIVYIVRNPYEKIVSSWKMHCFNNKFRFDEEKVLHQAAIKGFEYYIDFISNEFRIIDHCKFNFQIEFYEKKFPPENILSIFLEDWIANPESQAKKICDFLDIEFTGLSQLNCLGSNRSFQRREFIGPFKRIESVNFEKGFSHRVYSYIRRNMIRIPVISKPFSYPKFEISDSKKRELMNYLRDDAIKFLDKHGKEPSFWDFEVKA